MASSNCNECLCIDVCNPRIKLASFGKCKHFKDRNRFVELPKCSDKNEIAGSTPEQPEVTEEQLRQEWVNYKKKDLAGLLLDLPCKPKDEVYYLTKKYVDEQGVITYAKRGIVDNITIGSDMETQIVVRYKKHDSILIFLKSDLGKTIFLTKTEAKQALKKEKSNGKRKIDLER